VGMGPVADSAFSIATMLISIPTGVKIFNWLATLWGGSIRATTALHFAVGLIGTFTIGGLSGIMHSSPPVDLQQTDSYFVVAHLHYVLIGGRLFCPFDAAAQEGARSRLTVYVTMHNLERNARAHDLSTSGASKPPHT